MQRLRLLTKAVRWRAASSATLFVIAIFATFTAAFGPIYSLAADESVIRDAFDSAAISSRGLTLVASLPARSGSTVLSPGARAQQAVQTAQRLGLSRWFGASVLTEAVDVRLPATAQETSGFATDLVARAAVCEHISLVAGSCPTNRDDVMISDRSASKLAASLGSTLYYKFSGQAGAPLKVVGVYRPAIHNDDYWFDRQFMTFAPPVETLRGTPPFSLDALFVAASTIDGLGSAAFPFVTEDMPLLTSRVDDSTLLALQSQLADFTRVAAEREQVSVHSQLPGIISLLEDEEAQMGTIVALSTLQLVLVDLLLLFNVVSTSARIREHEVALARLRGHSPLSVAAVGLLEPVVILVAGAPIGAFLAWVGVVMAGQRLLAAGTPVAIDWLTAAAVGLALAGGAVATVVATSRLLVRPLHDQLRTANAVASAAASLPAVEFAAVVLAVAGLVELAASGVLRGGREDPIAMIAPGLLLVAAAVIGIRIVRLGARAVVSRTLVRSRAAGLLIARRLHRLPSTSGRMLIPALALGLAVFDLSAYSVADHNRAALAGFQVGADRVLIVQSARGVDLRQSVEGVDSNAMAAIQYSWPGGSVLAVDAARFARVADWVPGASDHDAAGISAWLAGRGDPTKLRAVVTPDQVVFNGYGDAADIHAEALDGTSVTLDGTVEATAIPRLGASGALVDLGALQAVSHGTAQEVQEEVWVNASARPDITSRLAAAGILVRSVDSASTVKKRLETQGLALAFEQMYLGIFASLILAVCAVVFFIGAEAREVSFEISALRAGGWNSAALVRIVFAEPFLVIAAACLLGLASGALGAALALPSIPEVTDSTWPIPRQYSLPTVGIMVVAAAFLAVLVAAACVASIRTLRARGALRGGAV